MILNLGVEFDAEGFLVDRDDWSREIMAAIAEDAGIDLTDEIIGYVETARTMFEEDQTVPPIRKFSKATGGDRKGTHLNEIFHGAPMKKIARLGGLPKPTGCV